MTVVRSYVAGSLLGQAPGPDASEVTGTAVDYDALGRYP